MGESAVPAGFVAEPRAVVKTTVKRRKPKKSSGGSPKVPALDLSSNEATLKTFQQLGAMAINAGPIVHDPVVRRWSAVPRR